MYDKRTTNSRIGFVFKDSNLSKSKLKTIIENYKDFLIGKGSQVMIKHNGRIFLENPIQKFDTATYIQIFYLSNSSLIKQINTEIQRDEELFFLHKNFMFEIFSKD